MATADASPIVEGAVGFMEGWRVCRDVEELDLFWAVG